MSDPAPDPGGLQFDRAETPGAPMICTLCKNALSGSYFTLNASPFCPVCREQVQAELSHSGPDFSRIARAGLFGLAAAAGGAAIWLGVILATGIEAGIVAVVVGLMVGLAVRRGSGGLGGTAYQILAMALTYAAVVGAYMGLLYKHLRDLAPTGATLPLLELFKVAATSPFRKDNVLGLLIIGFALYEAWRLNKRVELAFQGPFNSPSAGTGAGGV